MIQHYWRIYKTLVKLNFSNLTAFRANFVNSLIGSTVWGSFHFITVVLLTSRTKQILSWPREDVILLTAGFSIFWGIFHVFFSRNFERMSDMIDRGQLDSVLLKPVDSQFLISVFIINFVAVFRILMGIVAVIYIVNVYHLKITIASVMGYALLMVFGMILIYSIWYLVLTLTIWFARLSNLVDLLFHISGVMRYPPDIFRVLNEFMILFLLPILLIISAPTKFLLLKGVPLEIGYLIGFSIIFFLFSRWFWKFALRHYTSASG